MTFRWLLGALLFCGSSGQAAEFYGRVVRVHAGDRLEVVRDGRRHQVRLSGITCPKGRHASQALEFTRSIAAGRGVYVREAEPDRHGSTWADARFIGGRSLAHELVRAGLATWDSERAPENATLEELERQARRDKVGIWAAEKDAGIRRIALNRHSNKTY